MANGMGSLYIGSSGLRTSQNALNTTANNLANVDTTGYVRQQVIQADRHYNTFDKNAAISNQQSGLGVSIADVIHSRDMFLDKRYRTETGRQSFYSACYSATNEIYTYFQELEGEAFQDSISSLYTAFEEFAKDPSDSVNQNLVMQKSSLFISRAKAVYTSLQNYQNNLNTKISKDIDRINELGKKIYDLNESIVKIEAGGVETAMELRDQRDNALDELAGLVHIDYDEKYDGTVFVSIEGVDFVNRAQVYEMGKSVDDETGYITPYWPQMSDTNRGQKADVFNFNVDISSAYNTDIGELKALVMQRGNYVADYRDIEGKSRQDYNDDAGMSVMLSTEAELDQFVHKLVTAINDIFCPNIEYTGADLTGTTADGSTFTITQGMKVLDADNCAVGSDGKLPPQELFSISKMYTLSSLKVNDEIISQPSSIPHLTQDSDNKQVAQQLGTAFTEMWKKSEVSLNPNATSKCTFMEYYAQMIGETGTAGSVYYTMSETLDSTVNTVDNKRQQVIGVSSDEELTSMIQFQNAYNAASRFMNVVSDMIETLINGLS